MKKTGAKMLTTGEVAKQLGAPYHTVMSWIKKGLLEAKREDTLRGPVYLVPQTAVDVFERPAMGRPPKPESELKHPRRRRKGQ
jgi:excisionase family DNA binding protein